MRYISKMIKNGRSFSWCMILTVVLTSLYLPGQAHAAGVEPMVAAGGGHTAALSTDGTVWAWGNNSSGQLGNGSNIHSYTPVQTDIRSVSAISLGVGHTVGLKSDGTVWAWGENGYGQLGDGTNMHSNVPVQVVGLTDVAAVAAEYNHTVALKNDGTVWTWGQNNRGQLGDGTTTESRVPVQVTGLTDIAAVDAGDYHTAALKNDGTVWTWGDNSYGQLGDGTQENSLSPVQVAGLDGVVAVAAGGRYESGHTVALKEDGTVWAWGNNSTGQLGDGTRDYRLSPVQVQDIGGVTAVAAGERHTVALKEDGTAWAWGLNMRGQLGNGETELFRELTPIQANITDVAAIAVGHNHTVALKNDGTIWSWGENGNGKLGDGSVITRENPVRILGAAEIEADPMLHETNLNGSTLNVSIPFGDSFKENIGVDQFTLNNAPEGLTVTDAVYDAVYSHGDCTLTLGYEGDFDTDIHDFSVTIEGDALDSGQAITTNTLSITAVDEPHITPDEALNERNLEGRTLTVDLQTGTFADAALNPGSLTLNNAPSGLSIEGVHYSSDTQCEIVLSFDGTDFDSDITNFGITIDGNELSDGNSQTTDEITITAYEESAVITANQSLEGNSLDGSLLSVILQNNTFRDGSLDKANFILNNAPEGLSISSVFYNDATHCVVTLSYDGTGFENDINDFSLTIKEAEMSSKGNVSSNHLTITTQPQELSISTGNLPSATVGTAYSETVQAAGGTGAYTWRAEGLPSGLSLNTETGEISGTPDTAGSNQVTFTVEDENGNSASKTINLYVNLTSGTGKYIVSPDSDSSYTNGTDGDGITAMTVKSGVTGFKYFTVNITPSETHSGDEVVVFVHLRNGVQLSINATSADFDSVSKAKAGFNVQAGDIIKAYVVDDLTNEQDFNPTLLQ